MKALKRFLFSLYVKATPVDLSSLGLGKYCHRISYDERTTDFIEDTLDKIKNKTYRDDILTSSGKKVIIGRLLPIMLVCLGSNLTSANQSKEINYEKIFTAFEEMNLTDEQIRCHILSVLYNSARSTSGNLKSQSQKKEVIEAFKKMKDNRLNRLTETLLKEPRNSGKKPKSDGMIDGSSRKYRKESPIWMYLRYGDSKGGSQGDRADNIFKAPESYKDADFLYIWDGNEVNDETISRINAKYPDRVYVTRLKDLKEEELLKLYDAL